MKRAKNGSSFSRTRHTESGHGKYFSRTVENLLMAEDPKLLEVAWVGPQEELNKTINAQPTITLMQVSLAEDLDKA